MATPGNLFARKPAPSVAHIRKTEWAYLAGIIDGEGCIRALEVKRKDGPSNWHSTVIVTQRVPAVLYWIEQVLPAIGRHRTWTRQATGRSYRRWSVTTAEEVLAVLEGCLPYLTLKAPQARIAVQLSTSPRPSLGQQEWLANRLAQLKKEGNL